MFIAEYGLNVTFHTSEWTNIHLMNVSNHHEKMNVNIAELNNSSDWKWSLSGLCCVFATFPFIFWKWSLQSFRWSAVESVEETLQWQGTFLAVSGIFRSVLHSQYSHKRLSFLSYHSLLSVFTLKTIPSKMSNTIAGKVDSFKGKASALWLEGLCGVPARRPRSGVSLSLASDGLQCTVQDGCYAIWHASGTFRRKKGIENWN